MCPFGRHASVLAEDRGRSSKRFACDPPYWHWILQLGLPRPSAPVKTLDAFLDSHKASIKKPSHITDCPRSSKHTSSQQHFIVTDTSGNRMTAGEALR